MTTTPDFGIPLVASQQAAPEITHNEALLLLQVLLSGVIMQTNTPPSSPTEGDAYLAGTSPTGAWSGKANKVAVYTSGGWRFLPGNDSSGTPITMGARQVGMRVYRKDVLADYVWLGSGSDFTDSPYQWVLHNETQGSF